MRPGCRGRRGGGFRGSHASRRRGGRGPPVSSSARSSRWGDRTGARDRHRWRSAYRTLVAEGAPALSARRQCPLDRLRLLLDDAKEVRGGTADATRPLFPLPIPGQAHPHERRHLRLGETRPLPHLARGHRRMNDGRALAFRMCDRLAEGSDQVISEGAQCLGFLASLSSAASARTVRSCAGVKSVFVPLG